MSASLMTARFGVLPFARSENRTALNARLPDASFDKCPVLEIKNSALFLGFAFQDIKDIKRRRTLPVQPAGGYDHDSCTDGAGRSSGAINLRTRDEKDPGMKSNVFDCFQTDSRQSAGFLIFNQSFYSSCFAPTRFAGWTGRSCAKQGRNSPNELKEGQYVRSANTLRSVIRLRISFTGLGHSGVRSGRRHDRPGNILYAQSLKTVN